MAKGTLLGKLSLGKRMLFALAWGLSGDFGQRKAKFW